jgi:hypothetical protein
MTVYRSDRERRDEITGHWQLLDEIMEAIRCEYQSDEEVIEALMTAMAKIIAQAGLDKEEIAYLKWQLDGQIDLQRQHEWRG